MRKRFRLVIIIYLMMFPSISFCQTGQVRIISGISASKHVNTFPLFEIAPALKKEEPVALKEVKPKKEEEVKAKEKKSRETKKDDKPEVKLADVKPAVVVKQPPSPEELSGIRTFYFDQKQQKQRLPEKAYYYRKAKFDKTGDQPKGTVVDFYVNGNKPKFVGQYKRYIANYEEKNIEFDGLCKFYQEDGAYVSRMYVNGRVKTEAKYSPTNEKIAETEFTSDGKRKKFTEYVFDDAGRKIGDIDGGLNAQGRVEWREKIFYPTMQLMSEKNFIEGCPTPKATFYKENGEKFTVYYQDFTCPPTNLSFTNQSNFEKTHKADSQTFFVRASSENKTEGIMQMPISYDFNNGPFEITVAFDLASPKPMGEFGIVWEYLDGQNYCYLKINSQKKTFEINSVKDGKPGKNMLGIKPQGIEINETEVRISLQKTQSGVVYTLNGRPLQHLKGSATIDFAKLPTLDAEGKAKKWGMGFYFKSNQINESIILKDMQVRLH